LLILGSALVGQFGTDLCVDCNEKDEKPLEMKQENMRLRQRVCEQVLK